MRNSSFTISFVIPTYNEQENIKTCVASVLEYCQNSNLDYEIIIIDNCSTDKTFQIIETMCTTNPHIRGIQNSRNFGPHNSPYYGLLQTRGDCAVTLVADMQTPLSAVSEFVEFWKTGYDLVLGVRKRSHVSIMKKITQKVFYQLMSFQSQDKYVSDYIGFGLYDKKIIKVLKDLNDPTPFFRGLIQGIGFKRAIVYYEEPKRLSGKSKQTFAGNFEYTFLGLTILGTRVLSYAMFIGLIFAFASFALAFYFLTLKLLNWDSYAAGISPILIYLCVIGSLQLISIGILSLYTATILKSVRRQPLVIEQKRINFD